MPLLSGLTFGFFDKPLLFEITVLGAPGPLKVEFLCVRDKTKGNYIVEIKRPSDDTLKVMFSNPTEGGVSGLLGPVLLVASQGKSVALMFLVDVVGGGNAHSYRFTYEFYEIPFNPPTTGPAT